MQIDEICFFLIQEMSQMSSNKKNDVLNLVFDDLEIFELECVFGKDVY